MRLSRGAVLIAVLASGVALAQEKKKPVPVNPNEVEVRLGDGSRVRMTMVQETLDIVTKYGKLTIPTRDIRRIEFGIRQSEETAKKVDEAIKRLASDTFKEREKAAAELVAVGAPAFSSLVKASKSKDLEVAQRAKAALDRIRQKVPENQLRTREDDTIQTAEFTVAGRISAATIRATTPIFGDTQLKVTDLRGIRWMGATAEVEVSVDASKYGTSPTAWFDTGIELTADDDVSITASGQVDLMTDGSGQYVTGPTGNSQWGGGQNNQKPGALLGKFGDNGPTFVVGESFKGAAKREGKLFLQIGMSPWRGGGNGPSGAYKVNIVGGRDTSER